MSGGRGIVPNRSRDGAGGRDWGVGSKLPTFGEILGFEAKLIFQEIFKISKKMLSDHKGWGKVCEIVEKKSQE